MTGLRIGSLFSGYGGLDLGVQALLGGSVVWHCEGPPPLLEAPLPGVPPLDRLLAGRPCPPPRATTRM